MSNCGMEGLLLFDELFGFDPQESSSFSSERFSIVIGLRSDIERPESFFGVSEQKILDEKFLKFFNMKFLRKKIITFEWGKFSSNLCPPL